MEQLHALFYSGQLIWLSSLAFYIYDSAHKVSADVIIIHRTWRGDWKALLPILPMQTPQRRFGILPLMTPFLPAVRVRFNPKAPALSVQRLRQSVAPAGSLRVISGLIWTLLFIAGPTMTALLGLNRALTLLVPAFLYCIACIFCILAYNRGRFRLAWTSILAIVLESLICPGLAANTYRRVTLRQRTMTGNVFALLATSPEGRSSASRLAEELQLRER